MNLLSFEHLQKIRIFSKSRGCGSKIESATPRTSYRIGHEGLLTFLELLSYCRFQNIIVISFEGLQKLSIFTNFGRYSSKIEPTTPISILNFSRAWQSSLMSQNLLVLCPNS